MIPVTYPSSVSTSKESQMVVFALPSVTGLQRWTDYIPVQFKSTGTANSFNTDGYLACDFLPSSSGRQAWVDYIPVFVDVNATDAWQVSANGFIPFNTLAGGGLGSSLDFNFVATGTLDPSITFTRASTGTFFNSAGVLTSAAINAPRFDYNPVTLAARGLLIEEARTNSIRNNTMVGAVAGTPGTLPTNWGSYGSTNGITQEIVGVGTEDGINYIDIKYSGTATGTISGSSFAAFESNTQIVAASGQTWAGSVYCKLVGGSTANLTLLAGNIDERTAAGGFLANSNVALSPTNAALKTQRLSIVRTLNNASTERVTFRITFSANASAAIDITLRIGLPQLEQGAFATSVIPTTTTALTRSADVASVNTLSPWYNATEGTLFAEYVVGNSAQINGAVALSDGTTANRMIIRATNASAQTVFLGVAATATQWNDVLVSALINTTTKSVFGYKVNDIAWVRNGGAVGTDTLATIPTVTGLKLGADGDGNFALNGYLRRLTYYPRRLSNAELQAITA